MRGLTPDLIERDEPVVDIEAGVLHPLRHDRPGELLELHYEERVLLPRFIADVLRPPQEQRCTYELEDGRARRTVPANRGADRTVDILHICLANPSRAGIDVGSIDGEAGDRLPKRVHDRAQGEVTGTAVRLRDTDEVVGEHIQLAGQGDPQDQLLLLVDELLEVGVPPDEVAIDAFQNRAVVGGDEEAVQPIEEFVSDRSRHRPRRRELLLPRKDLLDGHIHAVDLRVTGRFRLKIPQISVRVEEPVGMIHAQAGHLALPNEPKDQPMRLLEDFPALDADTGEVIDVEEAAIIDFFGGDSPVGEPVGLLVEERLERIERSRIPRGAIVLVERGRKGVAELFGGIVKRTQPTTAHHASPLAKERLLRVRRVRHRKILERHRDTLRFQKGRPLRARTLTELLDDATQDKR